MLARIGRNHGLADEFKQPRNDVGRQWSTVHVREFKLKEIHHTDSIIQDILLAARSLGFNYRTSSVVIDESPDYKGGTI